MPRSLYGVTRSYYYSSLEQESSDECWTCVIIPITFWIFVSLTLILGLYGSSHLVLGPNYSHLLEANSIFVNEIQVRREGQEGPTLYGFSHRPKLDVVRNWTMEHTLRVDPEYHQDSMTVWYVELSYGARVVTYIIILGVIILLVYFILKYLGHMDHSPPPPPQEVVQSERSPLLHSKESTSESSTYGTIKQDSESGLLSSTEDLYDGKICVICYDELRNCFFIPCGHCATCYTCGQRIENGENKSCPICRQGIYRARRMFNV